MSKEKKLSKEQLIGWNDQVNFLFKQLRKTFKEAGEIVVSFSSMEDAKEIIKLVNQAHQQIKSLIESSAQAPSEAELEEFVEKWADKFPVACAVDFKLNQKNIKQMLKEYDKLRRTE